MWEGVPLMGAGPETGMKVEGAAPIICTAAKALAACAARKAQGEKRSVLG